MEELIGEMMKSRKIRNETHKQELQNAMMNMIRSTSEIATIPEHRRINVPRQQLIASLSDLGFIWDTSLRNMNVLLVQDALAQPVDELPDDDWYFQACKAFNSVYENRNNPPPIHRVIFVLIFTCV